MAALAFEALPELVVDGANGATFRAPAELAAHLTRLLRGFNGGVGGGTPALAALRAGIGRLERWDAYWGAHAAPVLAALKPLPASEVWAAFHRNSI